MKTFHTLLGVIVLSVVVGCSRDDTRARLTKVEEEVKRLAENNNLLSEKLAAVENEQKKAVVLQAEAFSGNFYRDGYREITNPSDLSRRRVPAREFWDFRADGTVIQTPFHGARNYQYTYARKGNKILVGESHRFEIEPNGDVVYKEINIPLVGWEAVNERLTRR